MASFYSVPSNTGPLTGYRAASVTYSSIWEVGSAPYSIRILEGNFWTDSKGQAIPWAARKARQPGDEHHRFTRVFIGSLSFSVPLTPLATGLVGIAGVLLLGFAVRGYVTRPGNSGAEEKTKV